MGHIYLAPPDRHLVLELNHIRVTKGPKENRSRGRPIGCLIRYLPAGNSITVTIKTTKNGIEVSVHDNGIGIPENLLNNVFSRFFRISNAQTETYPGMGLGLYISAKIIERHGGSISVESTEGKGPTFYFALPSNIQKDI